MGQWMVAVLLAVCRHAAPARAAWGAIAYAPATEFLNSADRPLVC